MSVAVALTEASPALAIEPVKLPRPPPPPSLFLVPFPGHRRWDKLLVPGMLVGHIGNSVSFFYSEAFPCLIDAASPVPIVSADNRFPAGLGIVLAADVPAASRRAQSYDRSSSDCLPLQIATFVGLFVGSSILKYLT